MRHGCVRPPNDLALKALHEDIRATLNRRAFPDTYDTARPEVRLVSSKNVAHIHAQSCWSATISAASQEAAWAAVLLVASSALIPADTCTRVYRAVLVLVADTGRVISEPKRRILQDYQGFQRRTDLP
jgi:acyl-CoA thioester hydrolase